MKVIIGISVRNIHSSCIETIRDKPDGCGECYNLKTRINLNQIHFLSHSKHHVSVMKTSRSVLLREIIHVACGCRVEHANTFRVCNEACFGATSGGKHNYLESLNNNIL